MTGSVVVLSTADFDSAVWTNKQHLAVGLARQRTVRFVESMGLRRPTLRRADVSRMVRRVRPGPPTEPRHERPAGLEVIAPRVLPLHGNRLARRLNASLIDRHLLPRLDLGRDSMLWTFSPLTYGLERRAAATVYHSVDLIHQQPLMPSATLLAAERTLVRRADVVIASSVGIRDHLLDLGAREVLLWENVAAVELFRPTGGPRLPRAIFAGNLTPAKVDFQLLRRVADAGVPLALAGPVSIDGTRAGEPLADLLRHENVCHLGNLALPEVAREVARSQVGLIPYLLDGHTAGIFPMKVYEYLAAGLPVVSTALPSLRRCGTDGLVIATADDFPARVAAAVHEFTEAGAAGRVRAAQSHSWTNRIEQANRLLDDLGAPAVAAC